MPGKILRVVINGDGLDLLGAFQKATVGDWAALIGATGRNPFTVAKAMDELDKMSAGDMTALSGRSGAILTELIGDLVFLARRLLHERSPEHPDRPISFEESLETTPFVEALGSLGEIIRQSNEQKAESDADTDPTKAPGRTDANGQRRKQTKHRAT